MTQKRINDPQKTYHNQIEPLLQKLMRRCKHHNFPALAAISVPLTESTGVTATYLQPDQSGRVPTEFVTAKNALEPQDQQPTETVSEIASPAIAG